MHATRPTRLFPTLIFVSNLAELVKADPKVNYLKMQILKFELKLRYNLFLYHLNVCTRPLVSQRDAQPAKGPSATLKPEAGD